MSTFAVLCLFGSTIWFLFDRTEDSQLRDETEHVAELSRQHLINWSENRFALLRHMRNHAGTLSEFDDHAAEIMKSFPGYLAINWIDSDFTIQSVLPPEPNAEALGKVITTHPDPRVRDAIERATRSSALQGTLVDNLFQGGVGYVTYTRVLNADAEVHGYINGVFRLDQFEHIAQEGMQSHDHFVANVLSGDAGRTASSNEGVPSVNIPVEIPGVDLVLQIQPSEQYLAQFRFIADEVALVIWLIVTALLSWQLHMWLRRGHHLRDSRLFAEGLAESIPQTSHVYDCDKNGFEYFNGRLESLLGDDHAKRVRMGGGYFLSLIHKDDLPQLASVMRNVSDKPDGESVDAEFRLQHSDGSWRWFRTRNRVVKRRVDGATTLVGTTEDITDHKRMLEELDERVEYERLFAKLSRRFINVSIDAIDDELRKALQQLGTFVGVERCYISEFEEDTTVIKGVVSWLVPNVEDLPDQAVGVDVGITEWVQSEVRRHGHIAIDNVADLPCEASFERASLQEQGVQSVITIPIFTRGKLCGFLGLDCLTYSRQWQQTLKEQLLTVAQILGNAIERRNSGLSLQYRIEFENLITHISTEFVNISPEDFEDAIAHSLALLGEFARVDRAYLMVFVDDQKPPSHAFEWCREGVDTYLAEAMERSEADLAWRTELFQLGKNLEIASREDLPPEAAKDRENMELEGTHAMMVVPLTLRGRPCGYFGFDVVSGPHKWPQDTASLLRVVGEVFISAIDRVRADNERLELEKQVLHGQKLESLGVLAGGIAHDFNNLLVGMLGNADLAMAQLPDNSPARHHVTQLIEASRRAADLTQQMLAYSGRGAFVLRQVDLNDVVRETLPLVKASISKKTRLRLELAENLPPINADSTQIHQIAMNLFINASEALEDRPGDVIIRTGVDVLDEIPDRAAGGETAAGPAEFVYLEVVDTGIGMDAETRERIFDPFYTTKFTGRGLGLAAVAGIVKGHHGIITVDSDVNEGSVFRVLIPRAQVIGNAPSEEVDTTISTRESWTVEGAILVVDDEPAVREFVRTVLERQGLDVITAEGGQQATELFEKHWEKISGVVLDMTMPDMGGFEVYQNLQQIDANVRVVLSSGYSEQDATSQFEPQNLAGFIQKPFTTSDLLDRLRESIPAVKTESQRSSGK